MAHISISREHGTTQKGAKSIADSVVELLVREYDLEASWERHVLHFERPGVRGSLRVTAKKLEIEIDLNFLYGTFRSRIESEIQANLDRLLASRDELQPVRRKRPNRSTL
jgi:putative polyhydroxyalkanoate system protein